MQVFNVFRVLTFVIAVFLFGGVRAGNTTLTTEAVQTTVNSLRSTLAASTSSAGFAFDNATFAKSMKEVAECLAFLKSNLYQLLMDSDKDACKHMIGLGLFTTAAFVVSSAGTAYLVAHFLSLLDINNSKNFIRVLEATTKLVGYYELHKMAKSIAEDTDLTILALENKDESVRVTLSNSECFMVPEAAIHKHISQRTTHENILDTESFEITKKGSTVVVKNLDLSVNISTLKSLQVATGNRAYALYGRQTIQTLREGGELGLRMAIPIIGGKYLVQSIQNVGISAITGAVLPLVVTASAMGIVYCAKKNKRVKWLLDKISPYSGVIAVSAIRMLSIAMLSYSVHELEEVAQDITFLNNDGIKSNLYRSVFGRDATMYDLTGGNSASLLSHKQWLMAIPAALVGYSSSPSMLQLTTIGLGSAYTLAWIAKKIYNTRKKVAALQGGAGIPDKADAELGTAENSGQTSSYIKVFKKAKQY